MKKNLLKKLYLAELRDLYSAETQLVKALPKMAKAASSPDLRAAFEAHLDQTRGHVERLEEIFGLMDESAKGKHCKGMAGLIKEGSQLIQEDPEPEELDAGLISAAQRVEHYEIAGYGCVRTYARLLGYPEAVGMLEQTLDEEKDTDQKLTKLSEALNVEAMVAEAEEPGAARTGKRSRSKAA